MMAIQPCVYTLLLLCLTGLPVPAQDIAYEGVTYAKADNLGFSLNLVSGLERIAPLQTPPVGELGDAVLGKRQRYRCVPPSWIQSPNNPAKCRPPGAECCGTRYYYWPQTQHCCADGSGSCPLGTFCCPKNCCPPGGRCGADGSCSTRVTRTRTQSSTRTRTSTSTTTTASTSSTRTRSTSTATATRCAATNRPRQAAPPGNLPEVKMLFKEKIMRVSDGKGGFKRVCVDNREVMNSMCDGMKDYNGCISEEMQLKYEPDEKARANNRGRKCPDNFCTPQNVDCDPSNPRKPCNQYYQFIDFSASQLSNNHPFQLTCDEFPFANSKEGGNPGRGTSICVPAWQQNTQGGYLSGIGKRTSGPDRSYVLKLVGWDCARRRPKSGFSTNCGGRVRREVETTFSRDVTGEDLWKDFAEPGENYLLLYIGDLPAGVYTYDLNLSTGSFSDISIVDKLGEQHAAIPGFNAQNGRQTISFNLTYGAPGLALMGVTRDTNISMAYNATGLTGDDVAPKSAAVGNAGLRFGLFALPAAVAFGMAILWM
ncbi:hypothetical protein BDBG_02131 [Blastomyces gilchristii SLH14081]|uniref:Deoxyribonuclease NucA/NucB domain-containing protein n=1 Tax=Blastomyces gilchristii (strain SLH14081) TaxID=559298 RepID=A0A179UH12_BLAGS|nr:uncharacterized protein BDBG_02131 [Blastomyces gilchristii SLH14081]OAT05802.1 hypothetical protein BDBG_02131 [Blastomyces gilchristii SLH14081]